MKNNNIAEDLCLAVDLEIFTSLFGITIDYSVLNFLKTNVNFILIGLEYNSTLTLNEIKMHKLENNEAFIRGVFLHNIIFCLKINF